MSYDQSHRFARKPVVVGAIALVFAAAPAFGQWGRGIGPEAFDCTSQSNKLLREAKLLVGSVRASHVDFDDMPRYAEVTFGNETYQTRYWVTEGDIVPIFGVFYKVTALSTGFPDNVEFRRLSGEEIPEGLSISAESDIVPLRTACRRERQALWVDEFLPPVDDVPMRARIFLSGKTRDDGHRWRQVLDDAERLHGGTLYAEGDYLTIESNDPEGPPIQMRCTRTLLKIVMPDPDRHIPGWLELSKKAKITYGSKMK
jgi:hypothetical protein